MFIKRTADSAIQQKVDAAGLPVQVMLGIICYCYVRGVFSSKEIADRIEEEQSLRKCFVQGLPEANDVKEFRRRHAQEIEDLLEVVYRVFPPSSLAQPSHV